MYIHILILHVLGATIWTGGHLVLATCILPAALRQRAPGLVLQFESKFEKLGMPALIVQVLTGLWLASVRLPHFAAVLRPETPDERLVAAKLTLLLATIALAANARLRIIPRLSTENLPLLAWHIGAVTVISVLFVVIGVAFRTGGLF
jgi:putative copper export protein